jgi:hypothetical protein
VPKKRLATEARQLVEVVWQLLRGRRMIRVQPREKLPRVTRLRVKARLLPNERRNDIERLVLPAGQTRWPRAMPN